MYVYATGPIDIWAGWQRPSDLFRVRDEANPDFCPDHYDPKEWESLWDLARTGARLVGWEGDIREGPWVTVVPAADSGEWSGVIVAFKQDNNGTTFVCSPHRLPWIEAVSGKTVSV